MRSASCRAVTPDVFGTSGSAPAANSALIASSCPRDSKTARPSGVFPHASAASTSAPTRTSARTTLACWPWAARWSGVWPLPSAREPAHPLRCDPRPRLRPPVGRRSGGRRAPLDPWQQVCRTTRSRAPASVVRTSASRQKSAFDSRLTGRPVPTEMWRQGLARTPY